MRINHRILKMADIANTGKTGLTLNGAAHFNLSGLMNQQKRIHRIRIIYHRNPL